MFIAENYNGFFWTSSTSPYPDTFSLSPSLTLTLSYSHTLSISHSITLDMLNNFCFHLYAQKSLFIAKNCNAFFGHQHHPPRVYILPKILISGPNLFDLISGPNLKINIFFIAFLDVSGHFQNIFFRDPKEPVVLVLCLPNPTLTLAKT